MRRVAILCQNGAYGRHALSSLGAVWPRGFAPALVIEGPGSAPNVRPPRALALQLRAALGAPLLEYERQAPVLWAARFGARHVRVVDFVGRAAARLLVRHNIAALVCLGFGSLLDACVLDAVPLALNAHPSLLPRFRGPSPLFWWLRSGLDVSGVTIHHMRERADAGDIVLQEQLRCPPLTQGRVLAERYGALAGALVAQALESHHLGTVRARPQPGRGSWAPRPRPEDAFVEPGRWEGTALLRFVSGAGFWQTPRIAVDGALFFARCGLEFRPEARLPGDFVQLGTRLEVPVANGVVALEVQGPA